MTRGAVGRREGLERVSTCATLPKTRLGLKNEGFLFGSTGQFLRVGGRVGEGEGASWKGVAKVGAKQSSFDFIS